MFDKNMAELILPHTFDQFRCKSTIRLMLPCPIEQYWVRLTARMLDATFPPVIGTLRETSSSFGNGIGFVREHFRLNFRPS